MRYYVFALLGGMLVGAGLLSVAVVYNPLLGSRTLSPLAVTGHEVMQLRYSATADDSLIYTNDGESRVAPYPEKVAQLWEPTVRQTTATVRVLEDSRGTPAGIGVKFSSASEQSSLLSGEILMDSVWHIYIPDRGTLFVQQSENYWDYIRAVVIPAYRSSGDNWRGTWLGTVTAGPGPLGTARVSGGSGMFAELESDAREALSARAYAVDRGPVAVDGELSIELPTPVLATQ